MYYIGICDDGKNTCSELEQMVLFYAEQKSMKWKTAVWYTGESLCDYLKAGNPLDFLVKPIRQEQVEEVLDLAVKILGKNETKFMYQSGRDYYYIPYGDIRYFVSEGRKIRIVTTQGEKEFYGKLRELEKTLPKDFLKIHQSYLVHTLFVARYAYEEVELTDGTILSISKKYRKQVRERLLRGGEEI